MSIIEESEEKIEELENLLNEQEELNDYLADKLQLVQEKDARMVGDMSEYFAQKIKLQESDVLEKRNELQKAKEVMSEYEQKCNSLQKDITEKDSILKEKDSELEQKREVEKENVNLKKKIQEQAEIDAEVGVHLDDVHCNVLDELDAIGAAMAQYEKDIDMYDEYEGQVDYIKSFRAGSDFTTIQMVLPKSDASCDDLDTIEEEHKQTTKASAVPEDPIEIEEEQRRESKELKEKRKKIAKKKKKHK